jgi:hypothetical protein
VHVGRQAYDISNLQVSCRIRSTSLPESRVAD